MSSGKIGQITVAAVGRVKRSEWQSAQDDYVNRLKRYTSISVSEVKDSVGRGFPDSVAMEREAEALLKASQKARQRILLSPDGREMSSNQFARYLKRQIESQRHLAFLIGGPLGFAPEVTSAAQDSLSLSRLTFPHELARIVFLEQLYRAFTILRGEPYHK
ncbi:MAG: 23S rRNA (pseudouridine(1915)-N(3))-methyltransferase RlmH [Candidatus Promineifilaceae bacterium]|jgi:23S rRNA (pseudouridine1915-N3)-methyltransferase